MRIALYPALIVIILVAGIVTAHADTPAYSSLVYPGVDGRLVYVPDDQGNTIPDFSHAGYGGGGLRIPHVPVRAVVTPGSADDAATVQAAIDSVSALDPDSDGFRGAVLLRRGRYLLDTPLTITTSGVVLRGEGDHDGGSILVGRGDFTGMDRNNLRQTTLVRIGGPSGVEIAGDGARRITEGFVPVGVTSVTVADASGLHPGDTVIVRRHGNMDWIRTLGMDLENEQWAWEPFDHDFDRVITAVEGRRIVLDAPLTLAIEDRWGGGELIPYRDPGRIEHVGVENLRGESEYNRAEWTTSYSNMDRHPYYGAPYPSDEDHYWNFIGIDNAKNVWVRNVTVLHFAYSSVYAGAGAKWVTVRDCTMHDPVSLAAGGRRFVYRISGQLVLVEGCVTDKGRHSFVLSSPSACGPNVFLDCTATRPYSSSEPHNRFSVGALYDNVTAPLTARFWKDISIGWAGANTVFWNCTGQYLIQKPPAAQNYAIGHTGIHACVFNTRYMDLDLEGGYLESMDYPVTPCSLYRAQLADRLGAQAVHE